MADNKSKLTLVKLNKADLAKGRHVLIVESPESRRAVALNVNVFSIGRHPHNDLVISDQLASRHHATVAWMRYSEGTDKVDYSYWIIDGKGKRQRSRNGIYINDKKKSLHRLTSGDIVWIGDNIKISYNYITYSTDSSQFLNYCSEAKTSFKSSVPNTKSDKDTMVIEGAFPNNDLPDDSMMLENTIVSRMPEDRNIAGEIRTKE
ncbi:MAG: FHA domain-containing protein [Pleurocapsa minor HA4230-MV1]|jgi:pSer/pThr/pTyr-binding forkhead associated (FHA) protein|nr:FHA domain-containing protein [Pleurocapsa minor HA4230-MV1]